MQLSVGSSITTTEALTSSTSIGVAVAIEIGMQFGAASGKITVTNSVTQTMSKMWSSSARDEMSVTMSCPALKELEDYDGQICMWQYEVEVTNAVGSEIKWRPRIITCTRGNAEPACPPFEKCADESCTSCVANM